MLFWAAGAMLGHRHDRGVKLPPDPEPDLGGNYRIAPVARRTLRRTVLGRFRSALASQDASKPQRCVTISAIDASSSSRTTQA
jgi:hypothetical protein